MTQGKMSQLSRKLKNTLNTLSYLPNVVCICPNSNCIRFDAPARQLPPDLSSGPHPKKVARPWARGCFQYTGGLNHPSLRKKCPRTSKGIFMSGRAVQTWDFFSFFFIVRILRKLHFILEISRKIYQNIF